MAMEILRGELIYYLLLSLKRLYAMFFPNWEEVLSLLWDIADGALIQDDLEIVLNYMKALKMDFERKPME
jgi:hypothetical protein